MGCTPSVHVKHRRGDNCRKFNDFATPDNNGATVDKVCESSEIIDPHSSNGNGRVLNVDPVNTEQLYKQLQQMRSARKESIFNEILLHNEQELKVLLVFDEEDETTEALISALNVLRLSYILKINEKDALESFSTEQHHLIIIDHRNHSTIEQVSLCRSVRACNAGQFAYIVAVASKGFVDQHEDAIIPLLSSGFNRILVETCSVKSCIFELVQLEHNLIRCTNMRTVNEVLQCALEGTTEAIQVINSANQVQYVNKACERLLDCQKSEIIGSNIQEVYGFELLRPDCSTETNGKNSEGTITLQKKKGDSFPVHYRITFASHLRNPSHIIYFKDKSSISCANKSSLTDASYDIQSYLKDSLKSSKKPPEFRSSSSDGGVPMFCRRQSVAKLQAMTIESPITKVISILNAVSENSPPGIASSLETVLDILCSTELYNPQHLKSQSLNNSEDQTTTDLVGGLLHHDLKKPAQAMNRRQSQENSSLKGFNAGAMQLIPDFSSAPSSLKSLLMKESHWDFDVIQLEKLTTKRPLVWLGMMIFARFNVSETLQCAEQMLHKWLTLIEANYHSKNTYHNSTHAADVLQATAYFIQTHRLKMIFDPMDQVACLLAAIIHDMDHPGKTSAFLCNSNSQLAVLYNDLSVLESHHAALAFKLTRASERVNIFQNLERETYRTLRKSIVDMVLATEMTKHFEHLSKFVNMFTKPAFNAPEISANKEPDAELLMVPENIVLIKRILIKCADVNNPLRPLPLCIEWAHRIAEEYFAQTDDEKRLDLPVMMPAFDRATCNIAKSQIGFIDYFINDMFAAWDAFVDVPDLMIHLRDSYNYWKEQERIASPTQLLPITDADESTSEKND